MTHVLDGPLFRQIKLEYSCGGGRLGAQRHPELLDAHAFHRAGGHPPTHGAGQAGSLFGPRGGRSHRGGRLVNKTNDGQRDEHPSSPSQK